MSPMKQSNNYDSSNYGESALPNVLATCYIVDTLGSLRGLHYCSTGATGTLIFPALLRLNGVLTLYWLGHVQGQSGIPEVPISGLPSPPSSPPLVAITSSNELAVLPKDKSKSRSIPGTRMRGRRGGATHIIREECVRFFCETMSAVFCGEQDPAGNGSDMMGEDSLATPPDDRYNLLHDNCARPLYQNGANAVTISAWAEVWDYLGGTSYRAFVADQNGEKTLFAFLDHTIIDLDLKQGLMALIELAESALGCARIVMCVDRDVSRSQAQAVLKSFRWVGFDLATLDFLSTDLDVTSEKWLFLSMDV